MIAVKLTHRNDPRYLIVDELPDRITAADAFDGVHGKLLTVRPAGIVVVAYPQPDGPGTDWIRPHTYRVNFTDPERPDRLITATDLRAAQDRAVELWPMYQVAGVTQVRDEGPS